MNLEEVFVLSDAVRCDGGLSAVPKLPGVYEVVNRLTRRVYVGSSANLRIRCGAHIGGLMRGQTYNGLIGRDLALYGPDWFVCIALETFSSNAEAGGKRGLSKREDDWIAHLGTHQESVGYNAMHKRVWTKGASLRDRERKLLRRRRSYVLLDGVDLYDPISDVLLNSWTREPRITER